MIIPYWGWIDHPPNINSWNGWNQQKSRHNEKDNHLNHPPPFLGFNMLIFQGVKFPLLDMPWVGKRQAKKIYSDTGLEEKPARRPAL